MGTFLHWLLLAAVVDNLVLARLLGLPGLSVIPGDGSIVLRQLVTRTSLALMMAMPASWLLQHTVLQPFQLGHLRVLLVSLMALLCATAATWLTGRRAGAAGRIDETLLAAGTTVLLGAALSEVAAGDSLLRAFAAGLGGAAGFAVAMYVLDAIGRRLATAPVPAAFRGLPISLLAAGLLALGLAGFGPP